MKLFQDEGVHYVFKKPLPYNIGRFMNHLMAKKLCMITVMCPVDSDDSDKEYLPKKKEVEAKLLKGEVYRESYDKVTKLIDENYDGIFRIFISYPVTVKLKVDNAVEEWVAIIDASNCDRILDKKLIDVFKEL
ncbi:hypothetical protein GLOIN_2v1737241 [Rhizophagus clarus]|uniref:Uncharacterized protein n=1 Tax=Rhizophagus clarus TaxID=94130 RepID=A0A8H3MK76_9GLOM|nr:hypothetical protein GLOIN_2v1737241 [Rhizophagus clarus]